MDAYGILVIILACALAIFLVLAIILTSLLIKIAKHVRNVTEKAEDVANNVAAASQYVKPAMFSAAASKFVDNILNNKRKGKGE